MDANEIQVQRVFTNDDQFRIPVFQRYYEWDKTHWNGLLDDILALFESGTDKLTHFIGPFVFITHAKPGNSPKHLIIDGQQRLITLTLIFAALRTLSDDLKLVPLSENIIKLMIFKDDDGVEHIKVVPRPSDSEVFNRLVKNQEITVTGKKSTIYRAYKYFEDNIRNFINVYDDPSETLKGVFQTVKNLMLVQIILDATDNPSNIYESLNHKGKRLDDADLIKNFFYMQLDIDQHADFEVNIWRPFEDLFLDDKNNLNKKWLADFYYRYLISKEGYFAKKNLYVQLTDFVNSYVDIKKYNDNKRTLEELIPSLVEQAQIFLQIKNADHPDEDISFSLKKFSKLDVETAIPFLLHIFYEFNKNVIDKPTFLEFLNMTESFILRRSFLGLRTRGYGLDFATAIDYSGSLTMLEKYYIDKDWPDDERVAEALGIFKIYSRESKKAHLILSEIERAYGHKEKVILDDLQIEHILPQTLTEYWEGELGDNFKEKHERLRHVIGNLTLTGYNGELGNRSLSEKIDIYKESNLEMNKEIERKSAWNESDINDRTSELVKGICKIWRRPK